MHVKMCCLALWGALIAAAGPAAADEHDIHAPFEQLFYCTDGDSAYNLYLLPDGTLQARAEEPTLVWSGTYSLNGTEVTVNVADVSFRETSLFSEVALGFLVAFRTPSLFCHAIGHARGEPLVGQFRCPAIRHIPDVSYQDNAFELYPNRMVKRRRWNELVAASDTLYREIYGIYYVEGNRLYMAFGDNDEDRFLSGTVLDGNGFTLDELEPERGPCVAE